MRPTPLARVLSLLLTPGAVTLSGACSPANQPASATTAGGASGASGGAASVGPATSAPQVASGAARIPPPLPPSAPGAPGLDALLGRLQLIGTRRFDRTAQARGCPADQTLGEYVALLIREGSPTPRSPDTLHRLSASCRGFPGELAPVDPPASEAYWYCQLDAFVSDREGESPWHYELRLRVRRSDSLLDEAHLSCPGTP